MNCRRRNERHVGLDRTAIIVSLILHPRIMTSVLGHWSSTHLLNFGSILTNFLASNQDSETYVIVGPFHAFAPRAFPVCSIGSLRLPRSSRYCSSLPIWHCLPVLDTLSLWDSILLTQAHCAPLAARCSHPTSACINILTLNDIYGQRTSCITSK